MEELCLKLKQDLENYFSMPFEIQPVFKDGEVHYVCSPYNEDQMYFSVEVYIHNKIRLVIEIYPQKHGGYILNEMAHAPEEKQSTFFSYKQMLVDKGLKSCYSVNKSDLLEIKIKQSKAMKVADAARQTHNQCNQKKRNVAEHSHNLNRKKAVVTLHLINK